MRLTRSTGSVSGLRGYGVSLAVGLLLTITGPVAAGEVIRDTNCKFVLRLPEGFQQSAALTSAGQAFFPAPSESGVKPEMLHCRYLRMEGGSRLDAVNLAIMRLPPIVRTSKSLGPRGDVPGTTPITMKWRDFDIGGREVPQKSWTGSKVTCMVEVDLKPNSVMLTMTGPAARKVEVRDLLQQTLAGLEGEMNYEPPRVIGYRPSRAFLIGRMIGIAVASCVVVITLLRLTHWLPKGCVLVLALLLSYAWGMQTLLGGLVGVFGVAIGIVDLLRRRQPTGMPPLKF